MHMAYRCILSIDGINDDITQPYCLIDNPTILIKSTQDSAQNECRIMYLLLAADHKLE